MNGSILHFVRGDGTLAAVPVSGGAQADWSTTSGGAQILNTPDIRTVSQTLTNSYAITRTVNALEFPGINLGLTVDVDGWLENNVVLDPVFYALDGGVNETGMPFLFKNQVGTVRFMPFYSGPGPLNHATYFQGALDNMVLSKEFGAMGNTLSLKFGTVQGGFDGNRWAIDQWGNLSGNCNGSANVAYHLQGGDVGQDWTATAFNDFF